METSPTSPRTANSGQGPRRMLTLPPPLMPTCTYPQPPGDRGNSLPTLTSPEFIVKGEEKVDQIS